MNLNQFLILAFIHLVGILSPGQTTVSVARFSIKNPKQIFLFIAGISISEAICILLAVSGFNAFLIGNEKINLIFRIISALYLSYFAILMIKNTKLTFNTSNSTNNQMQITNDKISILQGFTINILNPSTILFYLSIITNFTNSSMSAMFILTIIIYLILASFAIYYAIGCLFVKYQQTILPYFYYIEKLCGLFFIYMAYNLVF